ncbi:MAG: hypothetical protein PHP25_02740 [Candidatus Moranbacteria bacterium]|nr:hypothetical protein [Candidatus Moranbacteria bacterium]
MKAILVFLVVFLLSPNAILAGEHEAPRSGGEVKIVYDDDFLPPHVVAGQELAEIREGWSAQELFDLLPKKEKDDENF